MHTFHSDFDGDGDVDLAILWSRYEPYYGGNYIQILDNDGAGNFSDITSLAIDKQRRMRQAAVTTGQTIGSY